MSLDSCSTASGYLGPLMARAKKQIAKREAAREAQGRDRVVATNRRARREYDFLETFEAGIVLQGSEVKSLREGKAQLTEAYARVDDGEMWLFGCTSRPGSSPPASGPMTPNASANCCCTGARSTSWPARCNNSR